MDRSHLMFPGTSTDVPSEALPLFHDHLPRRPYQSYCETVASSRPPSPDSLIPKPLRITPAPPPKTVLDARAPSSCEVDPNTALILSAANGPEQNVDVVTLPKTGSYSKSQTGSPNRKPLPKDAILADVNHIARAVTPRGSHSLAPTVVTVYARTPSHPRVQQSIPSQGAAFHTVLRKPIQQYDHRAELEYHPLPPLPLEPVTLESNIGKLANTQGDRLREKRYERLFARTPVFLRDDFEAEEEGLLPQQADQYTVARQSVPEPYIHSLQSKPRRSVASEKPLSSPDLTVPLAPRTIHLRESSQNLKRGSIENNDTQLPSSDGLYVPRGLLSDIADDRRAPRRTRPKDANLRYQFGELPYRDLDLSPPIPSQRDPYHYQHQFSSLLQATSTSAPSSDSMDTQPGPRPAPWGTFSDLELQRQQRGDARKRAQIRQYRLTADSLSSYRLSDSSDSLCKDPKSEVKEYREQIRRVYPDMVFDGEAGSGGRCWCCNVM